MYLLNLVYVCILRKKKKQTLDFLHIKSIGNLVSFNAKIYL